MVPYTMIRECAWCREILGPGQFNVEQQVTHTICESCVSRMMVEAPDMEFLAHMRAFASVA